METECFASLDAAWSVRNLGSKTGESLMVGALSGARGEGWHLSKIAFLCNGNVGTLICDTGASITAVSQSFVRRAKLPIRAVPEGAARNIQVADGKTVVPVGVVDLPLTVQLILTLEDGSLVHWDRRFTLNDVWCCLWVTRHRVTSTSRGQTLSIRRVARRPTRR